MTEQPLKRRKGQQGGGVLRGEQGSSLLQVAASYAAPAALVGGAAALPDPAARAARSCSARVALACDSFALILLDIICPTAAAGAG